MDAQAIAAQFPPEYLEDYSGHKLAATCITAIVLNIFFVFARFTSRWLHNTPRGWDDFLMIPALIFSVLLAVQGLIGINYCGVGHHIESIELTDPSQLIRLYKLLIFFPATYAIAVTFPKLSILAMYLRIFTVPFYRMVTYFVIYILVISSTTLFMMMLFQCTPVDYFWNKSIVGGKCHFDIEKLFLYASLPNIITDIIMLALPMPFIFRLNMTRKMKVGLGITLITGSSGLATSILRFVSFAHQSLFPDTPRAAVNLALYTILETSMYIIAACLPACRPLFNILRHPSRNLPNKHGQKDTLDSPDENERMTIDDIELQRKRDGREGGSGSGDSESHGGGGRGRYHGLGGGIRGMGGRFKRLGSDAGLFLAKRDSPSKSTSPSPFLSPSPSLHPPQSQPHPHPQPHQALPQKQKQKQKLNRDPDPDRQLIAQAEGRLGLGRGLGIHKLRSQSRERIFKPPISNPPFRQPDRVHIANMHVGHEYIPVTPGGIHATSRNEIRVKQEFDVYYDRAPL